MQCRGYGDLGDNLPTSDGYGWGGGTGFDDDSSACLTVTSPGFPAPPGGDDRGEHPQLNLATLSQSPDPQAHPIAGTMRRDVGIDSRHSVSAFFVLGLGKDRRSSPRRALFA
jgi:hypothetical protein